MSQENPEKVKVRIPVLVSRTGEMHTGWYARDAKGNAEYQHDSAIDCFSEEAYAAGYVVVYVNAEIDENGLFDHREVNGTVDSEKAGD